MANNIGGQSVVRAAGALVWREKGGHLEVLLVHRPKYDDWSFPKGKVEPRESLRTCAVREIAEETGIEGRVLRHLATIDYWFAGDDHRVHKVVHHFLLEATGGSLTTENDPDHEAEDVAWVALEDVARRLAYPNERRIVAAAREILVGDG